MSKEAKLNPILFNLQQSVTEELKRSNHPDFATSSELKARDWSGVRKNSLTDTYEFWVAGEIRATVTAMEVSIDRMALEKKHIEIFGLLPPTRH